jgi:hypothetical protein
MKGGTGKPSNAGAGGDFKDNGTFSALYSLRSNEVGHSRSI